MTSFVRKIDKAHFHFFRVDMRSAVSLVLRPVGELATLEQCSRVISSFLGPPRHLAFNEACRFGSIALLEWIWSDSSTTPVEQLLKWSLNNFLRSDPHYHNWQFVKSLEVAVSRGDLLMLQWLFAHFPGCEVPTVDIIERDIYHRTSTLIKYELGKSPYWSADTIQKACENGQLIQYLNKGFFLGQEQQDIAIKHALRIGDLDLAERLLPRGGCLLDYYAECPRVEMVEWAFSCGYLRRSCNHAALAIQTLASNGRLDLAKSITQLHSPLQQDHKVWIDGWVLSIEKACVAGHLTMLQWLVEQPLGIEAWESMKKARCGNMLLYFSAENGHVSIMEYLCSNDLARDFNGATTVAIEKGHTSCVKWLVDHTPRDDFHLFKLAIDMAAELGHLEILKVFHELDSSITYEDTGGKRRRIGVNSIQWSLYADRPIYWAAKGGHLHILQWFQLNRPNQNWGCAFDVAASEGHLEVVKWLYMNRPDSRSKDTLDYAVLNGHLDVVQWLHSNRFDRNTDWAMYRAAGKGHLKMVKWLCENIPQNYTGHAIDKAVRSGHFRVAHWLLSRFPDYKIGTKLKSHKALFSGKKAGWSENTFDMLLWLDGHASYVFTPRFLEDLRQNLSYYSKHQTLFRHVLRWLDEHYPTTTRTSS